MTTAPESTNSLSGHQKVAVLCMTLGPDAAAELTRQMNPSDAEQVMAEITRMEVVPTELAQEVLSEWEKIEHTARSSAGGGANYAREVLERAYDSSRADAILSKVRPPEQPDAARFGLGDAEPKQLVNLVRGEHPQSVGFILAHLEAPLAAAVLEELDPELGAEALRRMATMEKVAPEVMEMVIEALRRGSEVFIDATATEAGGTERVAAILNKVSGGRDELLFEGLQKRDATVYEQIKHLMFVFEDLVRLDKRSMQSLLQNVDAKELALALKVASDPLREKVESVMSQRALQALKTEMDFLGPVRISEIEEAQGAIINAARQLEASGDIVLSSGDDDALIE